MKWHTRFESRAENRRFGSWLNHQDRNESCSESPERPEPSTASERQMESPIWLPLDILLFPRGAMVKF